MIKTKVLIVDDDSFYSKTLINYLDKVNYSVLTSTYFEHTERTIREFNPDIVLLYKSIPGSRGLDLCRKINRYYQIPVIIYSDLDNEIEEVLSIDSGADDFLIKPLSLPRLHCRIKSVLRRAIQTSNMECSTSSMAKIKQYELSV